MENDRLQDWQAIIDATIAKAKEGDAQAREWLGRYVLKDPRLRSLAGLPWGSGKSTKQALDEMLDEMRGE